MPADFPTRSASGRFLPGRSGNPAGRPRGSRNLAKLLAERLDAEEQEKVLRVVIDRALAGDAVAARFCVARLVSRPSGRPLCLDVPEGTGGGDVLQVYDAALQAMVTGDITVEEAAGVVRMLKGRKHLLEEQRVRPGAKARRAPVLACK